MPEHPALACALAYGVPFRYTVDGDDDDAVRADEPTKRTEPMVGVIPNPVETGVAGYEPNFTGERGTSMAWESRWYTDRIRSKSNEPERTGIRLVKRCCEGCDVLIGEEHSGKGVDIKEC